MNKKFEFIFFKLFILFNYLLNHWQKKETY